MRSTRRVDLKCKTDSFRCADIRVRKTKPNAPNFMVGTTRASALPLHETISTVQRSVNEGCIQPSLISIRSRDANSFPTSRDRMPEHFDIGRMAVFSRSRLAIGT
jgi:hypothetical protein